MCKQSLTQKVITQPIITKITISIVLLIMCVAIMIFFGTYMYKADMISFDSFNASVAIMFGVLTIMPISLLVIVFKWAQKAKNGDYVIYLAQVSDIKTNDWLDYIPKGNRHPHCQIFFHNLPKIPGHGGKNGKNCVYVQDSVAENIDIGDYCYVVVIQSGMSSDANVYPLNEYQLCISLRDKVVELK